MSRVDNHLTTCRGQHLIELMTSVMQFLYSPVHSENGQKSPFTTVTGKLEYAGKPFGLLDVASQLHGQADHDVLQPIKEGRVIIYILNVLGFSPNV